jgi:5-hydroxyisourate hydrolase-like protein (transthyretin family)
MSSIKKIYRYKRSINFGHFAIKAPNGRYAVAWKNKIITGKLKPGQFLCTPNFKQYYRHSTYGKYSKNPAKAGIKVGATDKYGVNRRQIVVLHWKATSDKKYRATSSVKCYAANDNGRFVGVSSGGLVDTVKFKGKTVGGHKLPKVPKMKYMGRHKFGNIDRLFKTPTNVKAPGIKNHFNIDKYFIVKVKNKKTKKAVKGVKIKIKLTSGSGSRVFTVKTDKRGVAKLNTKTLNVGSYNVYIKTADYRYKISGKSKITII